MADSLDQEWITLRRNNLHLRGQLMHSLRASFADAGYLEVTTPTLIEAPAPEEYIESIPAGRGFLRASPELAMKIMLCDGFEKIYQLGPCFRAGEFGRRHREEFTMLEFYRSSCDYRTLLEFTADLFRRAAMDCFGKTVIEYQDKTIDLGKKPEIVTVEEAFRRYAKMDWRDAEKRDVFDEVMVAEIEPQLGQNGLTALIDYPAGRASLARLKPENPDFAERWELYIDGLELANAFGELTDPEIQRERFRETNLFRARHQMLAYPEASDFFAALQRGMPPSAGCALGFDRLAMIFCNTKEIADVL